MMAPEISLPLSIAFSVAGLGLLLSFQQPRKRTLAAVDAFMRSSRNYPAMGARLALVLVAVVFVAAALSAAIFRLWPLVSAWLTEGGQPITVLEGISVWPTIFLRMGAFLLCIWFIADSWWRLDENIKKIAEELDLVDTRKKARDAQDKYLLKRPWVRFASYFWYREDEGPIPENGETPNQPVMRFWRMYVHQGHWKGRLFRVSAGVIGMILCWLILAQIFGTPSPPARGDVSFRAYELVTFSLVVVMLFLIFFVADTTLLSWRIVKAFREEPAVWPPETLQKYRARLRVPDEILGDWIDLIFVSKRTKCITTMIYYPFIIIALMVVSRSPLFANFAPSIPNQIATGVAVVIVVACAVALRRSAEASRDKARRQLNDRIVAAKASPNGQRLAGQLETLLRRVEELRDGAFTPFTQQPVVKAILLALGTYGGTALLEYFLLPGVS
jgi:hypothetical protein